MTSQLKNRSFVKEIDFTPGELRYLLDLAADLKRAKRDGVERPLLSGRNIALVFEKTSTRTRCAFEVGAYDQGAHVTYLDPSGSQMGHKVILTFCPDRIENLCTAFFEWKPPRGLI